MHIFVADEQDVPLSPDRLRDLAELVLREERFPDDTEVSILLVDDAQIAEYNERFMGRAGPTDVLAFPLEPLDAGVVPPRLANHPPINLGDVVIAPSYVVRQAERLETTFEREMSLMVVHGLLHLLGYDHEHDQDAETMEIRERTLLEMAATR